MCSCYSVMWFHLVCTFAALIICPRQASPFTMTVQSKFRQHRGLFHCCTFCSSGGQKSARCACGGVMPGKPPCFPKLPSPGQSSHPPAFRENYKSAVGKFFTSLKCSWRWCSLLHFKVSIWQVYFQWFPNCVLQHLRVLWRTHRITAGCPGGLFLLAVHMMPSWILHHCAWIVLTWSYKCEISPDPRWWCYLSGSPGCHYLACDPRWWHPGKLGRRGYLKRRVPWPQSVWEQLIK